VTLRRTDLDVLDALRAAYLVWAAVELIAGHPGRAVGLVLTFALLLVPRWLRVPWPFDLAFIVGWTAQSLGKFAGFWSKLPWWDTLVHTVLPFAVAPLIVVLLVRWRVLPRLFGEGERRRAIGALLVTAALAPGIGSYYEIYEWVMDKTTSSHYQPNNDDTMTDITANVIGGLAGGAVIAAWSAGGRPTERRRARRALDA